MRALYIVIVGTAALILTAQAEAQTVGGTAAQTGRPAAASGTSTTPGGRIGRSGGLDSRRAIIAGTAGSLGDEGNRVTGNTTPGSQAAASAGRPAGAPLGTGEPATGSTTSDSPTGLPESDPRRPH